MNKKSQMMVVWTFFGMMVGLMIWIAMTQMLGPTTDAVQDARSVSQLDCGNTSISMGTKATCIVVDFYTFSWVAGVITMILAGIGGGLIGKKLENN